MSSLSDKGMNWISYALNIHWVIEEGTFLSTTCLPFPFPSYQLQMQTFVSLRKIFPDSLESYVRDGGTSLIYSGRKYKNHPVHKFQSRHKNRVNLLGWTQLKSMFLIVPSPPQSAQFRPSKWRISTPQMMTLLSGVIFRCLLEAYRTLRLMTHLFIWAV